jgi:hypothetical protein
MKTMAAALRRVGDAFATTAIAFEWANERDAAMRGS